MTLAQLRYTIAIAKAGSMNEAAKSLYISQPSLSTAIRELEAETGVEIFRRTNRGIAVTPAGEEFLGYARQVVEQYELMEAKYISKEQSRKKFSVSMQHYTFAVNAFVELVKQFGMDEYEFAVHETKTHQVIEDVRNFKSEIGILYVNEFNRNVLTKMFHEYGLEFHELLNCRIYVYMWKGHPLANREKITLEELKEYPCLSFEQGGNNSFYFAEEVLSTYEYKRLIKADDRATMLNLMVGLNGYTLCSGIICEDLNGSDYCAVKLDSDEIMTIGYVARKGVNISALGKKYLEEISRYKDKALKYEKIKSDRSLLEKKGKASRSHTDHKTILTRFGCRILTVAVSKDTVAHTDIFLWNTPLFLQFFSFLGIKNFSCAMDPAGVYAESMCGIHEISHHKTSVFHTGAHFAVRKDNDHSWGAVERV